MNRLLALCALACLLLYAVYAYPNGPSPEPPIKETVASDSPAKPSMSAAPSALPSASASALTLAGKRVYLNRPGVRLRDSPGPTGKVIRESVRGESHFLTGRTREIDALFWAEIELNPGQQAWIASDFLSYQPPTERAAAWAISSAEPEPSQLHRQPLSQWPRAELSQRQAVSRQLTAHLLKGEVPSAYGTELAAAAALQACIDASATAPDLQSLRVYEVASTCALALKWF